MVKDLHRVEKPNDPDELGPTTSLAICLLCAILPLAASVGTLLALSSLSLGSLDKPGAAFWPTLCAILTGLLSVWLLIRTRQNSPPEMWTAGAISAAVAVLAVSFGVYAMPIVGFEIPTALILFCGTRLIGREAWLTAATTALAATAVLHLVFIEALAIPIPAIVS